MVTACCADTEKAVDEIQHAFEGLLHDCQFAFVLSNPRERDNPIVYASEGFYTMTGYSQSEVIGKNCRFLQGPETSHEAVREIRDAIREDRSCDVCLLNYRKDGSTFWNALHLAPLRSGGPSSCVEYYVGLQADVTQLLERGGAACVAAAVGEEHTHAEEIARTLGERRGEWAPQVQRLTACAADVSVPSSMLCALTKIQDCFVLADPNLPDMPIVYASPAFLRMTGYSCTEVLGRNCRFLQGPGTDRQRVQALKDALQSSPPRAATVTLLNYKHSGEPFWNCLHVAPVRDADGRVQFFAGIQLDVTAHSPADAAHAAAAAAAAGTGTEPGSAEGGPNGVQAEEGAEAGLPALNEPSAWLLLQQKGVAGAVRVAARGLAAHGLRREPAFQRLPSGPSS